MTVLVRQSIRGRKNLASALRVGVADAIRRSIEAVR